MDNLTVSVKNLAGLALADACPRCFWLKMKLNFKAPWAIFPGIFHSVDAYSKRLTALHVQATGKLPAWIGEFGIPIPNLPNWRTFKMDFPEFAITIRGEADEILKHDDLLWILDYKMSKHSDAQDSLHPMYQAQLNGYADIAEYLKMGTVAGMSLLYYQPVTDIGPENISAGAMSFVLQFQPHTVPVVRDPTLVRRLVAKARSIYDGPMPRSALKCKDCEIVNALVQQMTPVEVGMLR